MALQAKSKDLGSRPKGRSNSYKLFSDDAHVHTHGGRQYKCNTHTHTYLECRVC